ncbi:hypothetical protein [Martelella soudanensis]|uniref:hypothetical protein n=1 Tax=unclassified Martelella TaxID=2629616 RepID=UPI0015DEEFC8|nr:MULTISPECIES: hypothetical protein [unclassified Martelella]
MKSPLLLRQMDDEPFKLLIACPDRQITTPSQAFIVLMPHPQHPEIKTRACYQINDDPRNKASKVQEQRWNHRAPVVFEKRSLVITPSAAHLS